MDFDETNELEMYETRLLDGENNQKPQFQRQR